MTIVHDASGCNSTYSTHDEPRWYEQESMIYISALTELEAVLGDEEKLIGDVVSAAQSLHPKFITLCGAPIPMMTGTDFPALAAEITRRTGIVTFGLHTNGMHSYLTGASEAFDCLVRQFCRREVTRTRELSLNLLGVTPLDFSVLGMAESIRAWARDNHFRVISCLAMGSTLDEIAQAGSAQVNLVLSYSGLAAAKTLQKEFGTPYVVGVPFGTHFAAQLAQAVKTAAETGVSCIPCINHGGESRDLAVAGESVSAGSLACAIQAETGREVQVLCTLETEPELLAPGDLLTPDEDDCMVQFPRWKGIVADPMFRPICPDQVAFYGLPHEAYSGRCYRKTLPNLINQTLKGTLL